MDRSAWTDTEAQALGGGTNEVMKDVIARSL
jgi:hypothetical protein